MADQSIRAGLALLRKPNVGRLFAAHLISYTGTAMAPIAMAFGVLELTGSTSDASIVIAAPTVASIAVLLLGGVLADRTSRQKMIVRAEGLAMLSQLTIATLFISGTATVPLLTAVAMVSGTAMALIQPAAAGLIMELVPREELQSVNALLGMARNGAIAGGAALGGVLVATFGAGPTLAIDGVSFGLSALLILSLAPTRGKRSEANSILQDLKLGWQEFISHTWLWVIVAQFSLMVAVMESVFGLIGPAVSRELLNGAADWGLIVGSLGVGTFVGGLLSIRIRVRYPMRLATLCTFTFCAVPLALALPSPLYVISMAAFIEGVAGQVFSVLWYTSLQKKVPEHMFSKVSAYDHLGSFGLAPVGIVVAGFLFERIGSQATLLLAAVTVIAPTLAAISVRDVRMMTTDD